MLIPAAALILGVPGNPGAAHPVPALATAAADAALRAQEIAPAAAQGSPAMAASPAEALASLAALARERASTVSMRELATSPGGRPVTLWTLSTDPATADARPAVLLVAGLDADRPAHVAIAARAARTLLDEHADMLGQVPVHVIPCANPDSILGGAARAEGAPSRNSRPVDDDRDGVSDEDGAADLDGNGVITAMRRPNPPPGDAATHATDPAEPRLMRPADAVSGARPAFSMHTEGTDADADGLIGEDPKGGVDIDCNFPARWPEFASFAGATQLSEPESAAIARFVIERPRIVGALCLGRWESLARTPDPKPRDPTGKTPMELDSGDEALWKSLGSWWRDAGGQSRWTDADPSGCLALWLYAHRGLPAFSTQGWGRPDAPKQEEPSPKVPDSPQAAGRDGSDTREIARAKPADEEAAAWLAVSDRLKGGAGFVPWQPRAHPSLGAVEIGGFVPGFRSDPPPESQQRISDAVCDFIARLAERRPQVRIDAVTVEEIGPGVRRIRMRVANDGWLPTATAMGVANEAPGPIFVRASMDAESILSGARALRIASLPGYGAQDLEWIATQPYQTPIRLEVRWRGMDPQVAVVEGTAARLEGVPPRPPKASEGGTP